MSRASTGARAPAPAGRSGPVVVLAGGTGGAKLARGMLDVAGEDLVVVANTGDDIEMYGAHVSPDPDLCTFWLADRIDARGWGLAGDSFAVMDGLRELGREIWFNLGDRDLAVGLDRARRLAGGERLTDALAALGRALGLRARVLPMCEEPVRTRVRARGRDWSLQEFLILGRGVGPVEDVELDGIEGARLTPEVADALAAARAVVIGPSNPIISIGPILAVPGMREALAASPAGVVAVSPLVRGRVLKGPTQPFMAWAGHALTSNGVADAYAGVIDALLADEPASALPTRVADVLMDDDAARRRVAGEALELAHGRQRS
jgi:LPPG:FO 2-phospho-L-lactate transferase